MNDRKVKTGDKKQLTHMIKRPIFTLIALVLGSSLWGQQAQRFESGINTVYEEREPIPSPDGKTLYFWRREAPENAGGVMDPGDIWYINRNGNGTWSQARRFDYPLNTNGHDFVWQVSQNHDTLWMNQVPPGVKDDGLVYSVRDQNGYWSEPEEAHIRGFSYQGNYKDYFFSSKRIMLLPNQGANSYGGTDIYLSFPINDTAWAGPINLGPDINSAGAEDAPYLAPDGKTLYFTSNGHNTKGRLDIFVSTRLDNSWRNWSKPKNIGYPVNTKGDDFDFMISADGKTLFWCSDTRSIGSNDMLYLDLESCEVDLYPQGDHTLCKGEKITLEAGFTTGQNIRYQWLKDGRRITGEVGRDLTISESGLYQLVRMKSGCIDTSAVSNVKFVDPPNADIKVPSPVICLDDSIRLTTVSTSRYTYRWRQNGLLIPNANRSFYWVSKPGKYMVEIFDGGCKAVSEEMNLRSFREPGIYTAADTTDGLLPILPRWLWTNKIAKPKGESFLRDLTTSEDGSVYVLNTVEKRGKYYDQVTGFFPEGLYRMSLPEMRRSDLSDRFIATDAQGNIILASNDTYLEKYRSDGVLMWKKDEKRQKITGLAADPLGNIYTMGRFRDTLVLGTKVIAAANRGGLFIAKHDQRGALLWLETFPVDWYKYSFGNSLEVDCEGNVYIAGGFSSIANFRKSILRASLQGESYFTAKFTTEGNLDWAFKMTTEKTRTRTHDIHTDCEGNTFVAVNRELYRIDKRGVVQWHGKLKTPTGSKTLHTRIAGYDRDLYISGVTDRNGLFMTKLNRLNRQVIIWQRKGSGDPTSANPIVASNRDGYIFAGGISKGNDFPGAQFDLTSGSPVFVMKYGRPDLTGKREPMELCYGETITLLTPVTEGLNYQWIRNGKPISGAVGSSLIIKTPGTYQMKASSGLCERTSEPQLVTMCGDDPADEIPIVVKEDSKPDKKPVQEIESTPEPDPKPKDDLIVESDINYDRKGKPTKLKNRRIKSQEEIIIVNPEATIYVWDHAAVDQDTVSINVNGEWLLEEYGLLKRKKVLTYKFKPGDNFVMLYAHNLGALPPNTASITVDDGTVKQTLQLRSTLSNCGMLKVRLE